MATLEELREREILNRGESLRIADFAEKRKAADTIVKLITSTIFLWVIGAFIFGPVALDLTIEILSKIPLVVIIGGVFALMILKR